MNKITAFEFVFLFSIGAVMGDIGLYSIGYVLRTQKNKFLQSRFKFWRKLKSRFTIQRLDKNYLDYFLLLTRCVPGSRIPTYVTCGFIGYSVKKFVLLLLLSAILYCSVGVVLINTLTQFSTEPFSLSKQLIISLLAFLISTLIFKIYFSIFKLRQKFGITLELIKIKILRLKHLEYWPTLLLYLPFVPTFIYLLFKHRGFSPLAANPAIYMSGLIGERKSDIDQLIQKYLPEHHLQIYPLSDLTHEDQCEFPLVLKPDSGLRGNDVRKVNNLNELRAITKDSKITWILQKLSRF
ncbi:MAG: hypothetical protein KDD40_11650, partial [Bdellovibrionales bacterium]|nr:hypothetical protein [Bdellovibrionales bacterium]